MLDQRIPDVLMILIYMVTHDLDREIRLGFDTAFTVIVNALDLPPSFVHVLPALFFAHSALRTPFSRSVSLGPYRLPICWLWFPIST